MRLDEFVEDFERDEAAHKRQLVQDKSYEITEYLEDVEREFERSVSDDAIIGSTSPSIFVGRSNYPTVSSGVLSPIRDQERAAEHETGSHWYSEGVAVEDVLQRRSNLLNSTQRADVTSVADEWTGYLGVQREVAIADRPVDVEIGLDGTPDLDLNVDDRGITSPTGPRASARDAELRENPHVPPRVKKTLEDDDWNATGAMTYLYDRGFDVYDVNTILSAGALGRSDQRRLVPTRWSITAVDDTVSAYLRGQLRNATSIDETEVWYNEYIGNRFWVILTPGQWEYELVEMKAPESVWNPDGSQYWVGSDHEGYQGRSEYVDETAGAFYAARLGVLEHLAERDRQATALILREVTPDYWAPTGVWVIRETVRNAFDGECGRAESLHEAVDQLAETLPISMQQLRRKSELVTGVQSNLDAFARR
jgi:hypothetical protein